MGYVISVRNDWSKLGQQVLDKSQQVLDDAAQFAYDESQPLVPVDKGDLKDSGEVRPGEDQYSRELVYGTDHAFFVEFGTRFMAAQPYLIPAMNLLVQSWADRMQAILEYNGDGE